VLGNVIKLITPTFVLPRQGEGIRALPPVGFFISRPLAQPQTQFSKEIAKATKISEINNLEYLSFVLFATFVVKCLGPPWLRPCVAAIVGTMKGKTNVTQSNPHRIYQ
jgi:hypothetical protein